VKNLGTQHLKYIVISILIISCFSASELIAVSVSSETPNNDRASAYLSATNVYPDRYRITLTITNLFGETPPSSKWYGPTGSLLSPGCVGGSILREYFYVSGFLHEVQDHFYIRDCSRTPGQYRVTNGTDFEFYFNVIDPNKYIYLPLILHIIPHPPAEFSKLTPADGAEDLLFSVLLDWEDSLDEFNFSSGYYEYCIDTSDDDSCSGWLSTETSSQVQVSELSPFTSYYWQVRAVNNLGTEYANGSGSAFWSFTSGDGVVNPGEMILIPSGSFQMGCDPEHFFDFSCYNLTLPLHEVYLDDYYIDKFEVTNTQYAACVSAGACSVPQDISSWSHEIYYGNPDYDDYPVINVTWQNVYDYCSWVDKRLPTEAEWEKAAKDSNLQTFPWGEASVTCDLANYSEDFSSQCVGDTIQVGSYLAGASPYGLLDMAGNVQEWVNDWYAADYYSVSPLNNPTGPGTGTKKVVRGGGCFSIGQDLTVHGRSSSSTYSDTLGFRCAATP